MIIEIYNEIFNEYQKYIYDNNIFGTTVAKSYTNAPTKFPFISCQLSNSIDTDYCTIDKIEKYDGMYLTIDIYTKDKTIDGNTYASNFINDELTNLTIKFFESKNMRRTLCKPTPNADKGIMRKTIQYQGLVSCYKKNIIRR